MAQIKVYIRAVNDTQQSEWIQSGTYYIDTRKTNETVGSLGTMQISAYDAMMKAEADYPNTSHAWPYADISVVNEIAQTIGVTVDPRTTALLTARYMIDLPIGYTMRETLGNIAAAYGGNFVITQDNALLFVPLYGSDPDINGNYLADDTGTYALTFGNEGWFVLV